MKLKKTPTFYIYLHTTTHHLFFGKKCPNDIFNQIKILKPNINFTSKKSYLFAPKIIHLFWFFTTNTLKITHLFWCFTINTLKSLTFRIFNKKYAENAPPFSSSIFFDAHPKSNNPIKQNPQFPVHPNTPTINVSSSSDGDRWELKGWNDSKSSEDASRSRVLGWWHEQLDNRLPLALKNQPSVALVPSLSRRLCWSLVAICIPHL